MESKNKDLSSSDNPAPVPPIKDLIIDLPKLSMQSEIRNSDIILAILEICTFNKKYNYDCSNNTKAFWDRVVEEGILKKIFKNFKSETLRKYWKIIRNAGNTEKFVEAVRKNEKFINNPVFKLLPLINALAYYIQTDEKDFEEFFGVFNDKNKKNFSPKVEKEENNEKKLDNNLLGNKRAEPDNDKNYEIIVHKEEQNGENKKSKIELKQPILARSDDEQENDKRMLDFDDIVNRMMKISKLSREEVLVALYGTSYNIKNAFLYLKDNEKYDKYFFQATDDLVIEKMMDKKYFKDLVDDKGMELIEERKKFLGIK
jgi:NACalpha-BTF3-like transcription factor